MTESSEEITPREFLADVHAWVAGLESAGEVDVEDLLPQIVSYVDGMAHLLGGIIDAIEGVDTP